MDGGYIKVFNSEMKYEKDKVTLKTGKRNFSEGWAYWKNPDKKEATLGVKFSVFQPVYANYNVLDTDYETFAIVYSGSQGNFLGCGRYSLCWVLTREPLQKDDPKLKEIHDKCRAHLEEHVPDFNWDKEMRHTLQGKEDVPTVDYDDFEGATEIKPRVF